MKADTDVFLLSSLLIKYNQASELLTAVAGNTIDRQSPCLVNMPDRRLALQLAPYTNR